MLALDVEEVDLLEAEQVAVEAHHLSMLPR
jgi:hypothetical protein